MQVRASVGDELAEVAVPFEVNAALLEPQLPGPPMSCNAYWAPARNAFASVEFVNANVKIAMEPS